MAATGDLGLVPEPILEEMGRDLGNKAFILRSSENKQLVPRLIELMDAGEVGDRGKLLSALNSASACERYWAATWLGIRGGSDVVEALNGALDDEEIAVRIAAALAMHRLGVTGEPTRVLREATRDYNPLAGMYALRALEISDLDDVAVRETFAAARNHPYEFARRIANRAWQR